MLCGIPGKIIVNRIYWAVWFFSFTWVFQGIQSFVLCPLLSYVAGVNHSEALGGFAVGYVIQWIFLNAISITIKYKEIACIVYVSVLCWIIGQTYGTLVLVATNSYRISVYKQFPITRRVGITAPTHSMLVGITLGMLTIFPTLATIYPQWLSPIPQKIPGFALFVPWLLVGAIAGNTGVKAVTAMEFIEPQIELDENGRDFAPVDDTYMDELHN